MTYRKILNACLLAAILPNVSLAGTATANLGVSASVIAACSVSTTAVAFGNYSLTQLDGTGAISVTCTNGAGYTIALDSGQGSGATTAIRKMTSGSDLLNYALYQDSGRSNVWGSTGSEIYTGLTGSGIAQSYTVYGRVPANQTSPQGNYSDTVVVTVNF